MAYSTLRAAIQAAIKQNDNEEITGNLLQSVLLSIVNTVGAGYNFAGVATPSTNPGTPDGAMYWIGGKGTYANFGSSVTIAAGYLGIFMWDGSAFTRSVIKLSGGDGVFDVTDYTGNEYANLSAALAAIPQVAKAGGMEIRYVQSSDHKYVQYRYMGTSTANADFTNVANWQVEKSCGGFYKLTQANPYLVNTDTISTNIKAILVNSILSKKDGYLVLAQDSDDGVDFYHIEDPAVWREDGWQTLLATSTKPYLRIVVKSTDNHTLSEDEVCLISSQINIGQQVFDLNNKKVDKVNGKGLSTNDFSDALKNKLVELPTSIQINSTIFKMVENATSAILSSGGLVWDNYRDKFAYAELSDTDGTYLGLVQESNYPPSQNDWDNIGSWSSSINSNIRQISSTYFRILIKRADGGNLTINDVYLIDIKPSETNNEKVFALENKWTLNTVFHLFPNLSGSLMWTNAISSSEIEKFKESNLSVLDGTYTVLVQESSDGNTFVTPTGNGYSINTAKQFSTITEDYFRILIRKEDGTDIVNDGAVYIDNVKSSLHDKVVSLNSQWNNRQWFAFGTSMSDTSPWEGHAQPSGRYPKYLVELSGLYHHNWAVKGSMLAKGEDDPQRNSILKQIRIAAGLEPDGNGVTQNHLVNADLITIEGLINDYAHSSNLAQMGSIDDMNDSSADNQTIYGALYLAIKYCYEANPNARIVLITDTSGSTSGVRLIDKNGLGYYISDYAEAMLKAAQHMGCICIDAGSHSQIDMFHTQYLYDNLHHNDLGGEQYAKTIWEELKNINPCVSQS